MKRTVWMAVAGLLLASLLVAMSTFAKDPSAVQYNASGELKMPPNYREWVYLTTGIGMSYGPAVQTAGRPPMFTNVFVNPDSYRAFMASGKWPDKTIFVLEIYSSATHGSINKNGHYQDALLSLDVAVKDEAKTPKWAYYNFSPQAVAAKPFEGTRCIDCHTQNLRIRRACQLLNAPDIPLAEIATETGFADQPHFSRIFRRCTGTTPGRFRARSMTSRRKSQTFS